MATLFRMLMVLAVVVVVASGGIAQAADGQVPSAMLAQMGLSEIDVISDAEGEEVRGEGFVFAASLSLGILLVSNDISLILAGDVDGIDAPPLQTAAEAEIDVQLVLPFIGGIDLRVTSTSSGLAAAGTLPAP